MIYFRENYKPGNKSKYSAHDRSIDSYARGKGLDVLDRTAAHRQMEQCLTQLAHSPCRKRFACWREIQFTDGSELIAYTLGDNRKVKVNFSSEGNSTRIVSVFEAENTNPVDIQKGGWQTTLNNFKAYAEMK